MVGISPVAPKDEAVALDGLSIEVHADGDGCADVEVETTITLPPPASSSVPAGGGRGASMSAAFNPWTYMQFYGKITGQDVVNVDMIWNHTHLGWWQDGVYADYGNWWETDGTDAFWVKMAAFTPFNTNQHLVNNYYAWHQRAFHSDGFPTSAFPNVNASTELRLTGYYNGYATCNFYRESYDSGANFYPNLHWRNDCYWE